MSLYFITGSRDKFEEVKAVLPEVEQLDFDLPEIQTIDSKEVVRAKILAAFGMRGVFGKNEAVPRLYDGAHFIVDDTSLCLDALNGLPGAFVKWFIKKIGPNGLFNLCEKMGNHDAEWKTVIGYGKKPDEVYFFEGVLKGKIVAPRGKNGFGFDPILMPDGFDKTLAEISFEEKNKISVRRAAVEKMRSARLIDTDGK